MLSFQNLINLEKHLKYLQNKIWKNNIFLVWWSIRDILLWINDDPTDIDITTDWDPKDIYNMIDKSDISIFKTDKFWTITLIPKSDKNQNNDWEFPKLQYELTPLRTEWKYDDFRHPWEINWTNDIILDSNRRDFTINCMYYFSINDFDTKNISSSILLKDYNKLIATLDKNWDIYLKNYNLLILQNHSTISEIFPESTLNQDKLNIFLKQIKSYHLNNDQIELIDKNFNNLTIIIDPHKWIQNLIDKKLKAVWLADNRFKEDALRLVRAVRIVNILNQKLEKNNNLKRKINNLKLFDYDTDTRMSMKKNYYLVQFIAKERLRDEILKVFKMNNPFGFVSLIEDLNILKYIFPWLSLCKNIDQPVRYHPFDVYTHTILCLWHLQKINKDYIVKLSMIYHDVWKPDQYYYVRLWLTKEERQQMHGTYIHHPNHWADMAIKELRNSWYSNKEIDEIFFYVKNHMVPWEILSTKDNNIPKKLVKLMSEYWYERINNLFDLAIADRLWQYNPLQSPDIMWLYELKELLKNIYDRQWEFSMKDLAIKWEDIISEFNMEPSPMIWELLKKALERVLDDTNRNNKKIILAHLHKIKK